MYCQYQPIVSHETQLGGYSVFWMRLFKRVMRILESKPPRFEPPPQQIVDSVREEIKASLESAFENPHLHQLYKSVPVKFLMDESVKMFVGSVTCPRNPKVVSKLLNRAREIAQDKELESLNYYEAVFDKLNSMEKGDSELFSSASERLLGLAEEGHAIANYLVGKEMYGVASEMEHSEQKTHLLEAVLRHFQVSIQKGCFEAFYLLGTMFQEGQIVEQDLHTAFEYFVVAASFNNPFAYFKLYQFYKTGGVVEPDQKLEMLYLKKAAELGLVEAQHNLAIEYMNGGKVQKSQIKGLGWFIHASGAGFLPSKYNSAILFLRGTDCGTLKPNPISALFTLKEIHGKAGMDVSDLIAKIQTSLKKEAEDQSQRQ